MNKITVDPSLFLQSHGKSPRGRGSWAFLFNRADWNRNDYLGFVYTVPGSCTYGEALKAAKAEALKRGSDTLVVCP